MLPRFPHRRKSVPAARRRQFLNRLIEREGSADLATLAPLLGEDFDSPRGALRSRSTGQLSFEVLRAFMAKRGLRQRESVGE